MSCADYLSTMLGAARQLSVHLQFSGCWLACLFWSAPDCHQGWRKIWCDHSDRWRKLFVSCSCTRGSASSLHGFSPLPKGDEDYRSKELRTMAAYKLAQNRKELAWAIESTEGPFDGYLLRMSQLGEWGGETEIIMLSNDQSRSTCCPLICGQSC